MAAGTAPGVELSNKEIQRYGRQMILPEWGMKGQLAVKSTSVLIVGCGGLGCPAAQYLAAAGIGHLGLVDYDEVELGNLHRQVLHSEERVGVRKSESVAEAIKQLNSEVDVIPYHLLLDSKNAMNIIKEYDIILDCTDNVATRYLLNDSCVLAHKPLVSGSALRFEGQLTVYNYRGGPCYRCIFPTPPPPETVMNCSDGGVLGVVPGIIGNLQALEVLKIAAGKDPSYSCKLLLFDGLVGSFRTIRLRERRRDCAVCGDNPTVLGLIDYPQFCGSHPDDKNHPICVLDPKERVMCQEYKQLIDSGQPHLLVDVREEVQYEICSLPNSINLPMSLLQASSTDALVDRLREEVQQAKLGQQSEEMQVVVVCRRGNDSQLAVRKFQQVIKGLGRESGSDSSEQEGGVTSSGPSFTKGTVVMRDIVGGLDGWSKAVDPTFPQY